MNTSAEYIRVATKNFPTYKTLANNAMAQVRDEDLHYQIDPEANSIAQIIQHMSGNAISRFTDFFTSDGEKPDRNRDAEFEVYNYSRAQLEEIWERGWKVLFDLLDGMKDEDLQRIVRIRAEEHTVIDALNRQVAHYAYHVGQIVIIAKHLCGKNWNTLSIAKGKSQEFNDTKMK